MSNINNIKKRNTRRKKRGAGTNMNPDRQLKVVRSSHIPLYYEAGRDSFVVAEYDLREISTIEDVESFVRQAFRKKTSLMFKEGYDLVGENIETINYIKERFRQISYVSDKPIDLLLREIGADLIKFSNAFLYKARSARSSGGRVRVSKTGKRKLDPVAAYFRIPPETVQIRLSKSNKITHYRQMMPDGRYKDFAAEDIIHIYHDRKAGFIMGTPALIPVIDDIKVLRRIEENVELMVYKDLFPLYHYKVGTEDAPAMTYGDGTTEVDIVRDAIEQMPLEGTVVTSERHNINVIGAEGHALKASEYLDYFKKRVYAGLGCSSIDFGESGTSNRSTSETLSKALIDDVKGYQKVLSIFINHYIIKELLLESPFVVGWNVNTKDEVYFKFKEIDVDTNIKKSADAVNLFNSNLIEENEAREMIGYEPMTEEQRKRTFSELVGKPMAEHESLLKNKVEGSVSSAKNRVQPENQHGKKTGPQKSVKDLVSFVFDGLKAGKNKDINAILASMFSDMFIVKYTILLEEEVKDKLKLEEYSTLLVNTVNESINDLSVIALDSLNRDLSRNREDLPSLDVLKKVFVKHIQATKDGFSAACELLQ